MILRMVNRKRHNCAACKASYTIEASIIMPLFLFICVFILIFFRVLAVEWGVFIALTETAREVAICDGEQDSSIAAEGKSKGSSGKTNDGVLPIAIALAEARIADGGMPLAFVKHGALGMDFSKSKVTDKDIELVVSYALPIPMDFFGLKKISLTQRAKAHRWVGFDPKEGNGQGGDLVYVTESGVAYHGSLGCSYLNPSIRAIHKSEVDSQRNVSGHKYYACPLCRGGSGVVYITSYGESYHGNIGCSGLKRTIRTMSREKAEAEGYHACGKCGRD